MLRANYGSQSLHHPARHRVSTSGTRTVAGRGAGVDTLIGGQLAVLGGPLLWRGTERRRLDERIRRLHAPERRSRRPGRPCARERATRGSGSRGDDAGGSSAVPRGPPRARRAAERAELLHVPPRRPRVLPRSARSGTAGGADDGCSRVHGLDRRAWEVAERLVEERLRARAEGSARPAVDDAATAGDRGGRRPGRRAALLAAWTRLTAAEKDPHRPAR